MSITSACYITSATICIVKVNCGFLLYLPLCCLPLLLQMATLERAEQLLEELRVASYEAGQNDLKEVREFAAQQGCDYELTWWDVAFWAERLREARYEMNDEQLRPYFALPSVLEGLFKVWEAYMVLCLYRA